MWQSRHRCRIAASDSFCLFAALLILTIPLQWLMAAAAAATVHEMGHICTVWLSGGRINSIVVQPGSVSIHTSPMGRRQNAMALAAGPLASLSLLLIFPFFPRIAFCGAVQGVFNLLPLMPLDGGKLLRMLSMDEEICKTVETSCLTILICAGGAVGLWTNSLLPATLPLLLFLSRRRKIPCKPAQFGVQ